MVETAVSFSSYHGILHEQADHHDLHELSSLLGDVFPDADHTTNFVSSPAYFEDEKSAAMVSPSSSCINMNSIDAAMILSSELPSHLSRPARVSPVRRSRHQSKHSLVRTKSDATEDDLLPDEIDSHKRKRSETVADTEMVFDAVVKQKIRRRERNREHAKKSRSKKKNLTKELEEAAALLKAENDKLKKYVYQKLRLSKEDTAEMVKERIVTPNDRFVAALQKPSSRILTKSAISYLRSLGKEYQI